MLPKRLSLSLISILLFFLLSFLPCRSAESGKPGGEPSAAPKTGTLTPEPPPAPKGYKTPLEVMAALATKQIKVISQEEELPPGVVEMKDLEYGKVGERSLRLDLYLPDKLDRPLPGLIFIHGGAWSGGTRDVYRYYTVRFAKQGFVAATISYRLSNEAPFPAAVEDAKCAVRWLRGNAAKYHVDPDKIAVIGGSAGGHLAMMVGYSADVRELEGKGGQTGVSSRVAAVVNFYGPSDLTTPFARGNDSVKKFLGGKTYEEAKEIYEKASPITYLTRDDPPTLILHGTIDDVVPIEQSVAEAVNERCQFFMRQFFAKHLWAGN